LQPSWIARTIAPWKKYCFLVKGGSMSWTKTQDGHPAKAIGEYRGIKMELVVGWDATADIYRAHTYVQIGSVLTKVDTSGIEPRGERDAFDEAYGCAVQFIEAKLGPHL
jgi:hypothetical protein